MNNKFSSLVPYKVDALCCIRNGNPSSYRWFSGLNRYSFYLRQNAESVLSNYLPSKLLLTYPLHFSSRIEVSKCAEVFLKAIPNVETQILVLFLGFILEDVKRYLMVLDGEEFLRRLVL